MAKRFDVGEVQVSFGRAQRRGKKHGFAMNKGRMMTSKQSKLELSACHDKRWVLPDRIHTEPVEYHIEAVN